MESAQRLYLLGAFVAGVFFTLGFNDIYSNLHGRLRTGNNNPSKKLEEASSSLTDNPSKNTTRRAFYTVPEGVEACIGNTPLFKIKSLSQSTGCDILAKAEVW